MEQWVNKSAKNTYIKVDDMFRNCNNIKKWNLNY